MNGSDSVAVSSRGTTVSELKEPITEREQLFAAIDKVEQMAKLRGPEMVDHPAHYGGADNPYEHVKVAQAWGLVGNAFLYNCTKYICRVGKKGSALEDLRKAAWYLQKAIEQEQERP